MTRTTAWVAAAVAVLVLAAVGGVLIWRHYSMNNNQPSTSITLEQAGPVAAKYAADTAAHLTGHPDLAPRLVNNVIPCDQSEDRAPTGSSQVNDIYDLKFAQRVDPATAFNEVKAYWTGKGYKVISDDPATLATRTLTVENPSDGFRVGLGRGAPGNLFLTVSSPCLKPGSGTPTP